MVGIEHYAPDQMGGLHSKKDVSIVVAPIFEETARTTMYEARQVGAGAGAAIFPLGQGRIVQLSEQGHYAIQVREGTMVKAMTGIGNTAMVTAKIEGPTTTVD